MLGARQSGGRSQLRLLRLLRDEDLILQAREDAFAIVGADPKLERHPVLRELVASALDEEQAAYLERGWPAVTRIISGRAGGRRIQAPPGSATRPTSDRVREALFSGSSTRDVLQGARVLDLYAGSGALGLEAASRGAAAVVLVEQARRGRRGDPPQRRVAGRRAARGPRPGGAGGARARRRPAAGPVRPGAARPAVRRDGGRARGGAAGAGRGRRGSRPTALVVVERSARSPEPRVAATGSRRRWSAGTARRRCGSPTSPARPRWPDPARRRAAAVCRGGDAAGPRGAWRRGGRGCWAP